MAEFQPPEGLRKIVRNAIENAECVHDADYYREHGVFLSSCFACETDAVLAALFEACAVRERWLVKHLGDNGRSNWTRSFRDRALAEQVEADNRVMLRPGERSVLLRKVELFWTQPPPPVSSTGEETTGG